MQQGERRRIRRPWTAPCVLLLAGTAVALVWTAAPSARGQQPSNLEPRLARAMSRATAGERVQVLIQLTATEPPPPFSLDRLSRAAEHASNLADIHDRAVARLRREAPTSIAVDLGAAPRPLWIGGAMAAELTPDQIDELSLLSSVKRIYYDGLIPVELSAPADEGRRFWAPDNSAVLRLQGEIPWGLEAIGAPALWGAGVTGAGVVVAIIDSGVDADHPLVARKWRGLRVSPAEAWFDPWGLSDSPLDDDNTSGVGHGTIVATVAVGSLEPGDTIVEAGVERPVEGDFDVVTGVAPDAEWVAANAFERFGGGTYTRMSVLLQSMQWVLDPDSDPATLSDVPDVLNNSWGFRSGGCDGVFDRAIDALELAGIPVVFASGNRSAGLDTVAAPADRADLLLNAFAVGAVERRDNEIAVSNNSLGGPPPCAPGSFKPEVVAPGEVPIVRRLGERTALVTGFVGTFTSWAAPHASGALALLKGLNPRASANELKDALFSTAVDLPPPGLDNRSGAGVIDLGAAAERLGGFGDVLLAVAGVSWDRSRAILALDLVNRGGLTFPGGDAELQASGSRVGLATARVPSIPPASRATISFDALRGVADGTRSFTLFLESDGRSLVFPLSLAVASAHTLESGSVRFSLDGNGRLGRVAANPGFRFQDADWLTGGALLFADAARVSDAAYVDVLGQPSLKGNPVGSDTDWRRRVADLGADRASFTISDDRALHPIGVTVDERVDLVSIGDSASFVVLRASIESTASRTLAGLLLDWDFATAEAVSWDEGLGASLMTPADSSGPWFALTAAGVAPSTHAAVPLGDVEGFRYAPGSGVLAGDQAFGDSLKARLLALGGAQASESGISDWAQVVAVGPLGRVDTVVFLIAAGRDRSALAAALDSARRFALSVAPPPSASASRGVDLLPPYPNPFDPLSVASVNLPFLVRRGLEPVEAVLEIFTIAGRSVFMERRQIGPEHPLLPFRWDGRLAGGDAAASGVYGYVIRVGSQAASGKFVLLK